MHRVLSSWWNGISLRTKITGVTVLLLTLGLLVAGAGTMSLLGGYLLQEVDDRVENAAADIDSISTNCYDDRVSVSGIQEYYVAVLFEDGTIACDNRADESDHPDFSSLTATAVAQLGGQPVTLTSENRTEQWRIVTNARETDDGEYRSVVVGLDLTATNSVISRFAAIFMFFAIAVVVLGGALTRLLVTSTFAPLREVEATAARFADGDFGQRMVGAQPNTEVGRLTASLNAMLARIDRAFADRARSIEQMRRFIGDASHELRTPLVTLKGYAELYRMGALQNEEAVTGAMQRIEGEATRMTALVVDLLALARLDETRPLQLKRVDLSAIAHDVAMDTRAQAQDRRVQVVSLDELEFDDELPLVVDPTAPIQIQRRSAALTTGALRFSRAQLARLRTLRPRPRREGIGLGDEIDEDLPTDAIVLAEEDKIRQVVTNLLGNALRYTPEGSPLELGVGVDLDRRMGVIAVIDHGEGIPPQLRDKVFQRFWRADTSRTRETGGTGLGLSIVQTIVSQHGGEIEVDESQGGGATFRVLLPLAPNAPIAQESTDPDPEPESAPPAS